MIDMLELDLIQRCKSDALDKCYDVAVNNLFADEHGPSAGLGTVNANLELRCRALDLALSDLK